METQLLSNCDNCGAELEPITDTTSKCAYCGSLFTMPTAAIPAPFSHTIINVEFSQPLIDSPVPQKTGQTNTGCVVAAIVGLIVVIVFIVSVIRAPEGRDSNNKTADSLITDTSTLQAANKDSAKTDSAESPEVKATLKALIKITVNRPTFKKLYHNAYKKHDQFSGRTIIQDQTSPRYVNRNGIFAYIDKEKNDYTLRFTTQYTADDWLFIKNMTFNADGENFYYAPDFKTDNGNGAIWEWSDEYVTDDDLEMLIKIATCKKAKVKYDGDKYYKVVNISHTQQMALARELQIYKGLLLHYDTVK